MIEKIDIDYDSPCRLRQEYGQKINEVIDAVNEILDYAPLEMAMKAEPDYVTTSYMTDGHTKGYYGQNGASIVTDLPLPAGYVITIREPETKGGDNE